MISKYEFHDGCLFGILQKGSTVELLMESAELHQEDLEEDNLQLSKRNTLIGKLHLNAVANITVNNLPTKLLIPKSKLATILSFEINDNLLHIDLVWNIPFGTTDLEEIEIYAETIWWENIPTLESPRWPYPENHRI